MVFSSPVCYDDEVYTLGSSVSPTSVFHDTRRATICAIIWSNHRMNDPIKELIQQQSDDCLCSEGKRGSRTYESDATTRWFMWIRRGALGNSSVVEDQNNPGEERRCLVIVEYYTVVLQYVHLVQSPTSTPGGVEGTHRSIIKGL